MRRLALGRTAAAIAVPIGVVAIIMLLVVPIPAWLLDVLIVMNILLALVILLTTMFAKRPLDFSVFPSLLLIATLFRLGLNVASTRLVLGQGYAGEVIHAFGSVAVPWHLTTAEMVEQVRRVLRPDGVYVLNVIDFPPLAFARAEAATLLAAFDDVALMALPDALAGGSGGNLVLVASDRPIDVASLSQRAADRGEAGSVVGRAEVERFAGDARVLTDDDAPVDQLLTPYSPPRA